MKRVMVPLFVALAYVTSAFAQEDATEATEGAATEQPQAAEEPKKEDKKAPVAIGAKEERPIGIRVGFHYTGVAASSLYSVATVGWHLGALYDLMRIVDVDLGDGAFQLRILLEPGAFVASRKSMIDAGTQVWLEVPITAAFTLSLFNSMRVKYALGPYIAIGTLGTFSETIPTGYTPGNIFGLPTEWKWSQSRLDIGQWHSFGFEQRNFKNWWVDVTYSAGFVDALEINKTSYSSIPWAVKFSVGYNF
ncbi:MAG: hypothetical protein FWF67_06740 [Fibromonadales bacterium]|nr:hypothetical protein [Fibromonadales bacterium]